MTAAGQWGFAANTFAGHGDDDIGDMLAVGPEAEDAGFDSLWIGDHVLWHTPLVDGLTLLSVFAGSTSRIALGTAIYLLGVRSPAVAVRTVTSLNLLSGGRLILGVGAGGEYAREFEVSGVPLTERGRRLDAALRLLQSQWSESGDEPRFEPTGSRIPILVGGRSAAARRRVARYGDGWLHAFVSPARVAEETRRLEEESGRRPLVALHAYLRTGKDEAREEATAQRFLAEVYAMDGAPLMRYTVHGSVERCADRLLEYASAGVEHFVLRPAGWDQRRQLHEWGDQLLPLLRSSRVAV